MIPPYIKEYLKDKSLTMSQKISAIAMVIDPKLYPQKPVDDTNQLILGKELKDLLTANKIKYLGFDSNQKILIEKIVI